MKPARRQELRAVLRSYFAARPRMLALGAALAALTVLTGMGLLGLSGWFISATALAGLQASSAIVFDVFMPSAGIRLLAIGRTASRYGERLATHEATLAISARLREQLFRGWARPEAARRLLLRPASALFRLTHDIDALESLYLRVAVPAAAALGALLLAVAVLLFIAPAWAAPLALWLLGAGGAISAVTARRAGAAAMRRALALERLRAHVVDAVAGQTELVMARRTGHQARRVAAADARLARSEWALQRLDSGAALAWGVVSACTLGGMLLLAAWLVEQGRATVPVAALLVLLALAVTEPFAALRRGALELGRSALAARRLAPQLTPATAQASAARHAAERAVQGLQDAGVAVRIDAATLAPAPGAPAVFSGLTLRIREGERVAFVGPSGCGKSTLLAAIAGELRPRAGQVQVGDAGEVCLMTQRVELFQDSLRDNLRLGDPDADDARLWSALASAGLADEVRGLRQGLDTRLGEGGLGLSGGQARRLALARMVLRGGAIWLLDEASEGLDTRTASDVLQRLGHEARGRTLVIATHVRREAELADRLLRVGGKGGIVADLHRGTPAFEAALAMLRSG